MTIISRGVQISFVTFGGERVRDLCLGSFFSAFYFGLFVIMRSLFLGTKGSWSGSYEENKTYKAQNMNKRKSWHQ